MSEDRTGIGASSSPGAAPVAPVSQRVLDIVVAILLMIVFAPVMTVTAVLVRLTSAGPVIFTQDRVGRHGDRFTLYKFRTMRDAADEHRHRRYVEGLLRGHDGDGGHGDGVFKLKDDDRVTGVGRVLRRYSLDELPQLYNVLAGDMAMVGPRPAIPYEVALYGDLERKRLAVKPGITGLWQVSGRNLLSMQRMFELDAAYAADRSLRLDLTILARTPLELVRPSGAR